MNCPACGLDKSQVVYFSRLHNLMFINEVDEELNKAFSVLEAIQEHLLGITDSDGFVAKLEAARKAENA